MKGQANMGDTVVGVYYRPPDQEEEVDEAFYRQLEVASRSQALVLMGDFNHPDICWKSNTAKHAQSRRFLQSIDDNFLTQVVEDPTRRGMLLDLVLPNKEGLVGDVKVGGSLGCNDHEMVEFRILHGRSRAISRIKTLDFRRANFGLFKDLLGRIPWVRALEVLTAKAGPQETQTLEVGEKVLQKEDFPLVEEDRVREHLGKLDIHKSTGPDGMHPRVLRELADVMTRPLSIVFERSWRTGEVPEDWRKANVTLVFKKGKKEDPGNYRPVNLTSIPGKVMEQLILGVINKHVEKVVVIGSGQHGFTKGK
ncbi:mitochondrial enolase superfamily member 1 [Grus japonensis]|uniref:Mitochondrial enolase superfamily member 1 n=1 Tax=Grus japonensis TaxID=30415 RepID=A0ABC9YHS4_GRUJA